MQAIVKTNPRKRPAEEGQPIEINVPPAKVMSMERYSLGSSGDNKYISLLAYPQPVPRLSKDKTISEVKWFLPDETLIHIFKYLPTRILYTTIRRVCRRWRELCRDPYLWVDADFSFMKLRPQQVRCILKSYCHRTTKSIAFKGPAVRPPERIHRSLPGPTVRNKCLTPALIIELTEICPDLQSFSVSHEQLAKLNLRHLPATITRLSLPYCNISAANFRTLFGDCPFKQLTHLDLSGVSVVRSDLYLSVLDNLTLPTTVTSLNLDDTSGFALFVLLAKQPNLTHLSISYNELDADKLFHYATSKAARKLKSLFIRACLVKPDDMLLGDGDYTDWLEIWRQGFPALQRLDARNVILNSNNRPARLHGMFQHLLDVDGVVCGSWSLDCLKRDDREEKYCLVHRRNEERRCNTRQRGRRYRFMLRMTGRTPGVRQLRTPRRNPSAHQPLPSVQQPLALQSPPIVEQPPHVPLPLPVQPPAPVELPPIFQQAPPVTLPVQHPAPAELPPIVQQAPLAHQPYPISLPPPVPRTSTVQRRFNALPILQPESGPPPIQIHQPAVISQPPIDPQIFFQHSLAPTNHPAANPVQEPPAGQPPAVQPPAVQPPAVQPPAVQPPAVQQAPSYQPAPADLPTTLAEVAAGIDWVFGPEHLPIEIAFCPEATTSLALSFSFPFRGCH